MSGSPAFGPERCGKTYGLTFAMPFEDRAAAVATFGFTPRQARFLTLDLLCEGLALRDDVREFQ